MQLDRPWEIVGTVGMDESFFQGQEGPTECNREVGGHAVPFDGPHCRETADTWQEVALEAPARGLRGGVRSHRGGRVKA